MRIWKITCEELWKDMYRATRIYALTDTGWQVQFASYDWDELPKSCQEDLEKLLLR